MQVYVMPIRAPFGTAFSSQTSKITLARVIEISKKWEEEVSG